MPEPILDRTRHDFLPVARPSVGPREIRLLVKSMRAIQLSQGERVRKFERRFAEAHGCQFGAACNSGTSAIQLAIEALGLRGKRIAMPTMTMVACANAALDAGATPVFVDSDIARGNIDLNQLRQMEGIDAALVVHLYGVPVEFQAGEFDYPIIEDACEAHFGTFGNGDKIGSRGAAACFSFFANKILACGEGGMVTTNSQTVAERVRSLRAHAFSPGDHFNHSEQAHGMRMSEMQGVLGCIQMDRAVKMIARRTKLMQLYYRLLIGLDWLDYQYRPLGSAPWVMPLLISRRAAATYPLAKVRQHLADHGIETRPWFKPLHLQPHLQQYIRPGQSFPAAMDLWSRGFYLPLFVDMTEADVERICRCLRSI